MSPSPAVRAGRWLGTLALVFLIVAPAVAAPAPEGKITRPFLWRIDRPGAAPSWLFGTIHLPRPELTALNPAILAALKDADAVYTEIPNDPASLAAVAPQMLLPRGRTLDKELPADVLADARKELTRIAPQVPFAQFRMFKPWALAITLVMLEEQMAHPGQMAMDTLIFQRAAMAGKETGGLETAEQQLALFDELTAAEQATMVRDTITQLRAVGGSPADTLAQLYVKGDLAALTAELEKWNGLGSDPALTERFMEKILYARNETMARTILEKLRAHPDRSCFFAVGAAHLDGPRGLLNLLEKAGCTLTRAQ